MIDFVKNFFKNWWLLILIILGASYLSGFALLSLLPINLPNLPGLPEVPGRPTPTPGRVNPTPRLSPTTTPPAPTPPAVLPPALIAVLGFFHTEPTWDDNDMLINTKITSSDPWRIASYQYTQPQTNKLGSSISTVSGSVRCKGAGGISGIGNCDASGTLDTNPSGNLQDHLHLLDFPPKDLFDQNQGYIIGVEIKNSSENQTYRVYFGGDKTPKATTQEALQNPFSFKHL